jgi:hypothetical protein
LLYLFGILSASCTWMWKSSALISLNRCSLFKFVCQLLLLHLFLVLYLDDIPDSWRLLLLLFNFSFFCPSVIFPQYFLQWYSGYTGSSLLVMLSYCGFVWFIEILISNISVFFQNLNFFLNFSSLMLTFYYRSFLFILIIHLFTCAYIV